MKLLHHFLLPFWESKENWVEPQSFDTLISIMIGLYLLFTLIPDFIGYFALTKINNTLKIRTHWIGKLKEILESVSDDRQKILNNLYTDFVSNYLAGIDIEITTINDILHSQAKKNFPFNLTILILSSLFLFFSANYNQLFLIHKFIFSIIIFILLLIFLISGFSSSFKIKPNLKKIESDFKIIQQLNEAFKEKNLEKILRVIEPPQK